MTMNSRNNVNESIVGPGSYDLISNDISRMFSFGRTRRFDSKVNNINGPG